jgi:photosystem II stability/assembly factor-like uncharacterized protein
MPAVRHVSAKNGDVLLLVGTNKGAFVFRSNASRSRWDMGGPYFPGEPVYSMAYDGRAGRNRIYAGNTSWQWGPQLSSSNDFGKSWSSQDTQPIKFPEDTGATLKRVWQVQHGPDANTLYAGVEPSALFVSRDAGASWSLVRGLWNHPHREKWMPGNGGQCLHTILADPTDARRLTVAMSTGGVYRSDDGGESWQARNQGIRAEFQPDKYPEFGQCVHKVVAHPSNPGRMFLQNHWGLYRSEDRGDSWQDIANGVPSDFGFGMVMHPHDPDTVYIVPIESDMYRCTPEGKLRVYRTRNGGKSWEPLTRGLPQSNALETVLRDAMSADPLNPAGIYFGTRNGDLWGSADGGASWSMVRTGLPQVLCVRAAVVGDPAKVRVPKRASARKAATKKASARKPARKPARKASAKRAPAKRRVAAKRSGTTKRRATKRK